MLSLWKSPGTFTNSMCSLRSGVFKCAGIHTTVPVEKHRNARKGLRVPKLTPRHIEVIKKMNNPKPFWSKPIITPSSPLTKTIHPQNQFESEDKKIREEIKALSAEDEPVPISELAGCQDEQEFNPFNREDMTCILCPNRYAVDYIKPTWKNPKLLAQFVSPHTGLTYRKHITGLCEYMQQEVEREVKRAQKMGYLATKIKEVHYLKDPALFDPARPKRKNPY